jgi:hypothetical protein
MGPLTAVVEGRLQKIRHLDQICRVLAKSLKTLIRPVWRSGWRIRSNIVHLAAGVTTQLCTAVGSGCSGLLGNDYTSVQ